MYSGSGATCPGRMMISLPPDRRPGTTVAGAVSQWQ